MTPTLIMKKFNNNNKEIDTLFIVEDYILTKMMPIFQTRYNLLKTKKLPKIIALGVPLHRGVGKTPHLVKKVWNPYRDKIVALLQKYPSINTLIIGDKEVYKHIVGGAKHLDYLSERLESKDEAFKKLSIIPTPPLGMAETRTMYFNEAIKTLHDNWNGKIKKELLANIQHTVVRDMPSLKEASAKLDSFKELACDIETTGLNMFTDEILTISFTGDLENPICLPLHKNYIEKDSIDSKVIDESWELVWYLLYNKKIIGHNFISFDILFLLHYKRNFNFNKDITKDILKNMDLEDTMLSSYVLYNSLDRSDYTLKSLSLLEFGRYDKDVEQSQLIAYSYEEVASYNNIDTVATLRLYHKQQEALKSDLCITSPIGAKIPTQYKVYQNLLNTSKLVATIQFNGMGLDFQRSFDAFTELGNILDEDDRNFNDLEEVQQARIIIAQNTLDNKNKKAPLKTRTRTLEECMTSFNTNSNPHKKVLFFDVLGLPVLEKTKTKQPSTGKDSLEVWLEDAPEGSPVHKILSTYVDIDKGKKARNTFLKAIQTFSLEVEENQHRLFGQFKTTGTISSRLSSKNPNLQNMPSNSKYGKLIKSCFKAKEGYIWCGLDYAALEDRMLITETLCENKFKIFDKGYDGHSFHTFLYFEERLKEEYGFTADIDDVDKINSIAKVAAPLRSLSKPATFASAYGATEHTISKKLGITKEEAILFLERYRNNFPEIYDYNEKFYSFAEKTGYVVSSFNGLRLLVPLLFSKDIKVVERAKRTIGNFLIQSSAYILLMGLHEFQLWVIEQNLQDKVKMVCTIHDSVYFEVIKDSQVITKVNNKLIEILEKDYKEGQILHNSVELELSLAQKSSWVTMDTTLPKVVDSNYVEKLIKAHEELNAKTIDKLIMDYEDSVALCNDLFNLDSKTEAWEAHKRVAEETKDLESLKKYAKMSTQEGLVYTLVDELRTKEESGVYDSILTHHKVKSYILSKKK